MKWFLKGLIIFLIGAGFYLLTGDGSLSMFLILIGCLAEFRYFKRDKPFR